MTHRAHSTNYDNKSEAKNGMKKKKKKTDIDVTDM